MVAWLLIAVATPFAHPSSGLGGADAPEQLVATSEAEVDGDFAIQGEYLGQVRAVDGRPVVFGLQVVALGNGRFSALGYQDGLPGNGWDRENFMAWTGSREADALVLTGDRGTVRIRAGCGQVIDSADVEVGRVRKVRRTSATLGARPPAHAIVLFDGTSLTKFEQGRLTDQGWLAPGAVTKLPVRDFQLHLEFQTPYMPYAREQARGNSGVYIQRRYEVQILDSFGQLPTHNGCGALYRQQGPDVNMTFPPLAWQTFDVYFRAARWDAEGNKTRPAQITVMHNGVPVHRQRMVVAKTGAGQEETAYDGPLLFQDHGNPVQFRNVWLVARDGSLPIAPAHHVVRPADVGAGELGAPSETVAARRAVPWWTWRGY